MRVDSENSKKLRLHGIYVTNIYAAFVWLSIELLTKGGELVVIIPRSFCNGPYFLKFRQLIADQCSIDTIHTFTARNKAFAHDSVLQENVILHLSKMQQKETIKISYSTDHTFNDLVTKEVPLELVRQYSDNSLTIHIPPKNQYIELTKYIGCTLRELDLDASTGPIVDFRLKEQITLNQLSASIPLLYPAHISGQKINWPIVKFGKSGQYYTAKQSDNNVLPLNGCYVVVRRFSSKEEKRRIFAAVVEPENFPNKYITFENHLNYFHNKKNGFDKDLAYGLCAYLNSSILDEYFRKISGHTQVNVNDLKNLPYPNKKKLRRLGILTQNITNLSDDIIVKEVIGDDNEY